MKIKTVLGWIVLLSLSFIPIVLFFLLGPGTSEMHDYASTTHSLGEILGLVGMTMFALTFILSTRISWIEDVFGGLDKVYIVHGILGGTALIFVLFHPIFLVLKFIPEQISQAAIYLLPSSTWSVNFGIIALLGMILLIFITLFSKMKYHRWKFTHEFLGLMFFFAVLHVFTVRGTASQDNIFDGYYFYAFNVSFIGLFGFCYSLFIKNRLFKNAVYRISSIAKNKDSFIIEMTPEHKPIMYRSGQFIFVRFYNEKLSRESHPFSIASKSNNFTLRIVVRKLGDFTENLGFLKMGDKVSVEGPYGRFNYKKSPGKNQVWIAGGIGIVPFLGMAEDLENDLELRGSVKLFYSVKEDSDLVGNNLLSYIASKTSKFKYVPWNSGKQGRLTADIVYDSGNAAGVEFFLCGPPGFKEGIINGLLEKGIRKDRIHEEAFDFR